MKRFNVFLNGMALGKELELADAITVMKEFVHYFTNGVYLMPVEQDLLDPEWKDKDSFTLVDAGDKRIHCIKEIRNYMGIGLKEAKDIVCCSLPYHILRTDMVGGNQLQVLYQRLHRYGAIVQWDSEDK